MFANLFANQIVLAAFVGLLIAVAVEDIRRLTIPNRYCAAIALLYPIYVLTAPHGVDWIDGAIVGGVALAIGFLLFSMRLAGAGDVKLFSAVALWSGSHLLVNYIFVTTMVGGIIAIVMLIHRHLSKKRTASSRIGFRALASHTFHSVLAVLLPAFLRAGVAMAPGAAPAPSGTDVSADTKPESYPGSLPPVGTLPYGAPISVGGIVVAAMLLMRG